MKADASRLATLTKSVRTVATRAVVGLELLVSHEALAAPVADDLTNPVPGTMMSEDTMMSEETAGG